MLPLANFLQLILWGGSALVLLASLTILASYLPRAYLVLVATTYVASQWRQSVTEAGAVSLGVSFGSVNVGALDLLATVAAGAAALGVLQGKGPRWNGVDRLVAGLTALTVVGVLHWTLALGLQGGVNGWRSFLYAFCLYWWARVLLRGPLDRLLIGLAVFTASVQAYGYATTGYAYEAVLVNGQYFDPRPVHAESALLIVVGLAVVLSSRQIGSGWRLALGLTLGLSVLVSLHRSVWVGLIAALAVWGLRRDDSAPAGAARAVRLIPLAFVAIGVIAAGRFSSALSQASQSDTTLLWRVTLWVERLTRERSPIEWVLGGVAVPDSERDLGSFVGTSHSMYVDTLEMFGLVGLALLVVAMFRAWILARVAAVWSRSVLAAIFAFGFFYPWPAWAWLVLGYVVSANGVGSADRKGGRSSHASGTVDRGAGKPPPSVGSQLPVVKA